MGTPAVGRRGKRARGAEPSSTDMHEVMREAWQLFGEGLGELYQGGVLQRKSCVSWILRSLIAGRLEGARSRRKNLC